jgi:hypothetical protein
MALIKVTAIDSGAYAAPMPRRAGAASARDGHSGGALVRAQGGDTNGTRRARGAKPIATIPRFTAVHDPVRKHDQFTETVQPNAGSLPCARPPTSQPGAMR